MTVSVSVTVTIWGRVVGFVVIAESMTAMTMVGIAMGVVVNEPISAELRVKGTIMICVG